MGSRVGHGVARTQLAPGPRAGSKRSGPAVDSANNHGDTLDTNYNKTDENDRDTNRDQRQETTAAPTPPETEAVPVGRRGGSRTAAEEEERILTEIEMGIVDVFGDAYCNKHLMYSIIELVLVRLMPELAEKGVVELWEERLS
jgi:hypothetical protein